MQTKLPPVVKKQFKTKYQSSKKLLKQASESKEKVQRLLRAAFEEEMVSFVEQNQAHLRQAHRDFAENFGARLVTYMREHSQKKAIVLTSRVHPGEPQASFMMEGCLKMLLGESELARELRRHFVFRVVPMLNPDGVVQGNYRCSLLGCDLNRKWLAPNKFLHPAIFFAKQLVKYAHWERKVSLYCDLHGHSRKEGIFFYGCTYKNFEFDGRIKNAQLRILPLLCCRTNPSFRLLNL